MAMLGSVKFDDPSIDGQVNVAISPRQPGSTLKPFTYITAFGKGWNPATILWDDAAAARMKKIPAFVRGMVTRAVEDSCRRNGISRVTAEELERIRARMPTPKVFG